MKSDQDTVVALERELDSVISLIERRASQQDWTLSTDDQLALFYARQQLSLSRRRHLCGFSEISAEEAERMVGGG